MRLSESLGSSRNGFTLGRPLTYTRLPLYTLYTFYDFDRRGSYRRRNSSRISGPLYASRGGERVLSR